MGRARPKFKFEPGEEATEEWHPALVPGHEKTFKHRYEISNMGRLRKLFGKNLLLPQLGSFTGNGYLYYSFFRTNKTQYVVGLARVVLRTFVGPPPPGKATADHIDACRTNNRLANLRYASMKDQYDNCRRLGHDATGERHGRAIITEADVRELRRQGLKRNPWGWQRRWADKLGVSDVTVSQILSRVSWKQVD